MTRHSSLTNSNDLHYAKVRSFSGEPSTITPDFENQLLISTITNRSYLATGIVQGALIELGGSSLVRVGIGTPQTVPLEVGQTYFDSIAKIFYCAIEENNNVVWASTVPSVKVDSIFASNSNLTGYAANLSSQFRLFHSYELTPQSIPFGLDIRNLQDIPFSGDVADFNQILETYAHGVFIFGMDILDWDSVLDTAEIDLSLSSNSNIEGAIQNLDIVSLGITDGITFIPRCLYLNPMRRLQASFDLSLTVSSVS